MLVAHGEIDPKHCQIEVGRFSESFRLILYAEEASVSALRSAFDRVHHTPQTLNLLAETVQEIMAQVYQQPDETLIVGSLRDMLYVFEHGRESVHCYGDERPLPALGPAIKRMQRAFEAHCALKSS